MADLRTVIFIDGWNLKKNLQNFSYSSTLETRDKPYRLDEKNFDWARFFEGVIEKFNKHRGRKHHLIRAYWYTADTITPFIIDRRKIEAIKQRYSHYQINADEIEKLAHQWHDNQRRFFNDAKELVYERIQRETDFVEFKYVGQYKLDPYQVFVFDKNPDGSYYYLGKRVGERGVDVGIAVDMIAKIPAYDVAIIVSGDVDFLPAVHFIKESLKQVYQFSIAQGVPPNIKYLSPWLKGSVDAFQYFDEVELLKTYLVRKYVSREHYGRIPPPGILSQIDNSVKSLESKS